MHNESTRILLLTNDDGWDAPGLQALRSAAEPLGRCRVVAPSGPCSGCGHRVTTHGPIAVAKGPDGERIVAGTPADCVRLALHHLEPEPTWILSGINPGGNLGTDVYHSGTVAAVREGALYGRPGIAVSHYLARGLELDWEQAARWTARVLRLLMAKPWRPGMFWNVNLPHLEPGAAEPEVVFCPLDPSPLPLQFQVEGDVATYAGVYHSRARRPGGDVEVCFGGRIAVTLMHVAPEEGEEPVVFSAGPRS